FSEYNIFTPYYYIQDILYRINYNHNCEPVAGVNSLWAYIPDGNCSEDSIQILLRFIIIIIISFPLLIIVIFRSKKLNNFFLLAKNITFQERNKRLDAIALSLIFTGSIYYLGLLSIEQFIVCLGFLIFLFQNNIYTTVLL